MSEDIEAAPTEIDGQQIIYRDADGNIAQNTVLTGEQENGVLRFYELLGYDGELPEKGIFVDGKQKFKRLIIKRVFPTMEV